MMGQKHLRIKPEASWVRTANDGVEVEQRSVIGYRWKSAGVVLRVHLMQVSPITGKTPLFILVR